MSLQAVGAKPANLVADAVALVCSEGSAPSALGPDALEVLGWLGFSGRAGQVVVVPARAFAVELAAPVVAVAGLGPVSQSEPGHEQLRRAAGTAVRSLAGRATVGLAFGYDSPEQAGAIAEGAAMGGYAFSQYRAADPAPPSTVMVAVAVEAKQVPKAVTAAVERASVVAAAVAGARDLVNTPANDLTPAVFAEAAVAAAKPAGVRAKTVDLPGLLEGGYGGIVAVGQGSIHPPYLVKLSYAPLRAKTHVALVGKGITFDSGGLSIKPARSMDTMKSDMAGAAAVLQTICAAAQLKLPVKVTGYLALAENMPSGAAQHPSDVVTMKSGTTVEVTNTDAEGRLILADAITAALDDKPDSIIDIATLTGAQAVALGDRVSAVMGTPAVRQAVVEAAALAGEAFWPLPLPEELGELLKSDVADLLNTNLTKPNGGALTAGLFLQHFVGQAPWAHLDIASTAFNQAEAYDYVPTGGTGVGVRTLLAYLAGQAAIGRSKPLPPPPS
ncbi:MAG: leucyl aminopeptidase [Micrococcales bacterium]|nr:leucyl aminopeptidase [Micrococcales bacterium]